MDDLKDYEKYRDDKEICDYINDSQKLRYLYQSMQYPEMQRHIGDIMRKYSAEVAAWNMVNKVPPQTYDQMYQNAEAFLQVVGLKMLAEKRNR